MRKLLCILISFLSVLIACDTSNPNPGGHSAEEITKAKTAPTHPVPTPSPVQATSGPVNGQELFNQYCAVCHKDGKNGAPPLAGIMKRRELPSGTPANDARLKDTIKMGRANMPGMANVLTEEQVDAIVAYVKTL